MLHYFKTKNKLKLICKKINSIGFEHMKRPTVIPALKQLKIPKKTDKYFLVEEKIQPAARRDRIWKQKRSLL
jgi:hypothetical protein